MMFGIDIDLIHVVEEIVARVKQTEAIPSMCTQSEQLGVASLNRRLS